ncbi:MAG: homoserine O-acetyltransferase [Desulfovibrionaceae bacterium]|nr:homoserine O-acetyltransferase [Desulfovibrionaceae bacterium]MBF0513935.1 homoserine O-acetyltransferase [Desulfovibrionaceae bacterium]
MSEYTESGAAGSAVGQSPKRFFTFGGRAACGPFSLESGASLAEVTLAYETYGRLSEARDNAVYVAHALTGDSHAAGISPEDQKPGWWESMIGPGKGLDTDKYFVICANVLGGCMGSTGPGSTDPATGKPYGLSFPLVTIGDMVRAQRRLVDHLGVDRLLAVVGGSMGGMQVLEWAVRYPDRVAAAVPLATSARHTALHIAFHEVARQAILADPDWNGGDYYGRANPVHGLAVARMIGHITYLSDEAMRHKFGRKLQDKAEKSFSFDADFQVESYLRHQGQKFVDRFDANSFLYITRAADYFDLAEIHGQGSLAGAMAKAAADFLIVSFTSDWLYPTYQSKELLKALKKNGREASFAEIDAQWGHDAFLLPSPALAELIRGHLDKNLARVRAGKGAGNAL